MLETIFWDALFRLFNLLRFLLFRVEVCFCLGFPSFTHIFFVNNLTCADCFILHLGKEGLFVIDLSISTI